MKKGLLEATSASTINNLHSPGSSEPKCHLPPQGIEGMDNTVKGDSKTVRVDPVNRNQDRIRNIRGDPSILSTRVRSNAVGPLSPNEA